MKHFFFRSWRYMYIEAGRANSKFVASLLFFLLFVELVSYSINEARWRQYIKIISAFFKQSKQKKLCFFFFKKKLYTNKSEREKKTFSPAAKPILNSNSITSRVFCNYCFTFQRGVFFCYIGNVNQYVMLWWSPKFSKKKKKIEKNLIFIQTVLAFSKWL